jgi:hypothetical protein
MSLSAKLREVVFAAIPSLIERLNDWRYQKSVISALVELTKRTNSMCQLS